MAGSGRAARARAARPLPRQPVGLKLPPVVEPPGRSKELPVVEPPKSMPSFFSLRAPSCQRGSCQLTHPMQSPTPCGGMQLGIHLPRLQASICRQEAGVALWHCPSTARLITP
jgi:hypothetical protein